jgi:hypothetical protein
MALAHDRYLITGCSDNELRFFALRSTTKVTIICHRLFKSIFFGLG